MVNHYYFNLHNNYHAYDLIISDYIWLHIRAVGEWTNRLHDFFEKEQQRLENGGPTPEASGSSIQLATNIISDIEYKAKIDNMNEKIESTSTEPNQLAKMKA